MKKIFLYLLMLSSIFFSNCNKIDRHQVYLNHLTDAEYSIKDALNYLDRVGPYSSSGFKDAYKYADEAWNSVKAAHDLAKAERQDVAARKCEHVINDALGTAVMQLKSLAEFKDRSSKHVRWFHQGAREYLSESADLLEGAKKASWNN